MSELIGVTLLDVPEPRRAALDRAGTRTIAVEREIHGAVVGGPAR